MYFFKDSDKLPGVWKVTIYLEGSFLEGSFGSLGRGHARTAP